MLQQNGNQPVPGFSLYCLTYKRDQMLYQLAKAEKELIELRNETSNVCSTASYLAGQLDRRNAAKRARYAELKYGREGRIQLRLKRAGRSPAK
jgi:hypothetical protein